MGNVTLSISLVNTNNKALLHECLKSLFCTQHGVEFETIVVDNVSTDGSVAMVREAFPQVRLIINDSRKGFGANHNQAIAASGGRFVLVLNEDTVVKPGALRSMVDFLEAHRDVAAVGCRLENPDGTLQPSCYKFPSPARAIAENLLLVAAFPNNRFFGDYRAWSHDAVRYVDFVSGAAIMVRREAIQAVGTFDERFFIYAEETDWCYRMARAGWKVAFVPDGTIVHFGGQSSIAIKDRQFCEFNRSGQRYIRKHYGSGGAAINSLAMLVGGVLRVVLWSGVYVGRTAQRATAASRVRLWCRLLRWWAGFGPNEGIAELAAISRTA